ncbi:phosphotransferase enzyme family protein [Paraliobacillus sp. X-1268]|uniref:phosphotransferase enzyme family protein n=1 Tax=Paraliobacillus sp. X-1268 TaxID=2213193 RepID=UPI0013004A47|nr:phosphotransferase [Paraliobacillus sp. X-1268]
MDLINYIQITYKFKDLQVVNSLESEDRQNIRLLMLDSDKKLLFLKEKAFYLTQKDYLKNLQIQTKLNQKGMLVPKVLTTKNESMHLTWNGRSFIVQEWITGKMLNPYNLSDLIDLGKLIAEFQKNASFILYDEDIQQPYKHSSDGSIRSLNRMFEILHNVALMTNQEYGMYDTFKKIKVWFQEQQLLVNFDKLLSSWVHGDIHSYNVIKDTTSKLIPIDLDDLHYGYSIADLSWACIISSAWDWTFVSKQLYLKKSLCRESISQIIEGYENNKNLSLDEMKSLPYFLGFALINSFINVNSLFYCKHSTLPTNFNNQLDKIISMLLDIERTYKYKK